MLVINHLERDGRKYKVGNIKVIRVGPEFIEVTKKNREILKYRLDKR